MKNIVIILLVILNASFIYIILNADSNPRSNKIFSEEKKAEPFEDLNGNGQYDKGEPYDDENGNGIWDDAIREYRLETEDVTKRFINGKLVEEIIYFNKPQIKEVREYSEGIEHGDWKIYYPSNSDSLKPKIKVELKYVNGGLVQKIEYYISGQVKQLSWNPDLDSITDIINYYPNGEKQSEGQMIMTKTGKNVWYGGWIWYNEEDGSVKEERIFDQGL
tara:strand:- start:594 stop:1250 length:657 start_codon:yes stop_codon:yes gene_type:complete